MVRLFKEAISSHHAHSLIIRRDKLDLLSEEQMAKLLNNGSPENQGRDHAPVVKLYLPFTNCIWLLSELDPEEPDIAFGLCDLGMRCPELGSISLSELMSVSIGDGIVVQQDSGFTGDFLMSVYAEAAQRGNAITDDPIALNQAAAVIHSGRRFRAGPKPG